MCHINVKREMFLIVTHIILLFRLEFNNMPGPSNAIYSYCAIIFKIKRGTENNITASLLRRDIQRCDKDLK